MTLANEPDSTARNAIVQRDLSNVLHPIVPHKQLERQQLVIVDAHDSTIVDADGTEYLDAMAGLWCVNIGYGRTELATVAAEQMRALAYYPHTGMNQPASFAGGADQRAAGRRQSRLLCQLRFGSKRSRLQDRPPIHETRIPRRVPLQNHRSLLGISRRHPRRGRHGRAQIQVRAGERQ